MKAKVSPFAKPALVFIAFALLATFSDSSTADPTLSSKDNRPPGIEIAPTLAPYPDRSILLSTNVMVMPAAAPSNVAKMNVSTSTNFQGELVGDPATGIVRVTNANPAGTYHISVKAFSTTGETANASFDLTVTSPGSCNPVTFVVPGNVPVFTYPWNIAVGDFNGDGIQDFVVNYGLGHAAYSLLGDGHNHFATQSGFNSGGWNIVVGDFNGDGNQDLAIINIDYDFANLALSFGDGNGNFGYLGNYVGVGPDPRGLALGDFNGDGKQDLVVTRVTSGVNNVGILLGDGAGHFNAAPSLTAGANPLFVAVGDFNRDGKQDLAVANRGSNDVSILLGNGLGGFSPAGNFPAGHSPRKVIVSDFNNDNKQDLALSLGESSFDSDSQNIAILLGDGMGGFSPVQSFATGDYVGNFTIGDLNGDNKQDLVVVHNDDAYVSLVAGDGTGHFSITAAYPTGSYPEFAAVGDFNGDGRQDLAVTIFGEAKVLTLFQTCNTCALCHKHTTTLNLPCDSLEYHKHLDHGDTIGQCPGKSNGTR